MNLVRLQPKGGGFDLTPYKVTVNVDNEFNGTQITLYQGLTELKATAQNGKAVFYPENSGVWRAKGVYSTYTYYDSENGVDLSYFGDTYSLTLTIGKIHITIDWESVFNGSACVLTNGNKTFNLTLGTSGSLLQTVDEIGTWTATATAQGGYYEGQPFSGKVKITADGNYTLSIVIADGKTVTPTDDIQIWLSCANINDKNYTNISQVLADTTTLLALIASENACDYLVRSTDWSSSICTNQNAMSYIGSNEYCANLLLDENTWSNTICDSPYFECVLNAKVPTLDSNNGSDGGVASFYSTSEHKSLTTAYYGFDGNYLSGSKLVRLKGETTNYLQYEFSKLIKVKKIYFVQVFETDTYSRTSHFNIVGIDENGNETVISEITNTIPSTAQTGDALEWYENILNNTYYKAYRLVPLKPNNIYPGMDNGNRFTFTELQFYGRGQS